MLVIGFKFFNSSLILSLPAIYNNFQNFIPIIYKFNLSSITGKFHLTNFYTNKLNSKFNNFGLFLYQYFFAIFIIKLKCFLTSFTRFNIVKLNSINFEYFFI
jgi:hypothetical protein